jgi:hypothetical protein
MPSVASELRTSVRLSHGAVSEKLLVSRAHVICRYSKGDIPAPTEPKDSWYIRACFIHASILAHQSRGRKGTSLVMEVQRAAGIALQGIQHAKQHKKYEHLVYNGTLCFWQASRPLMRNHGWEHVHTQLGEALAALKEIKGHTQWKAVMSAAMAQCSAAVSSATHFASMASDPQRFWLFNCYDEISDADLDRWTSGENCAAMPFLQCDIFMVCCRLGKQMFATSMQMQLWRSTLRQKMTQCSQTR